MILATGQGKGANRWETTEMSLEEFEGWRTMPPGNVYLGTLAILSCVPLKISQCRESLV